MPEYNGHHCRSCWNVALWIYNDESTYRAAVEAKRSAPSLNTATNRLLAQLPARTPDGARYTFSGVRRALADLEV